MVEVNVVTAEIIRNRLVAVTDEMTQTLIMTAYNPVLYEVKDFSTILLNAEGEIWAETAGVIIFDQAYPDAVKAGIKRWNGHFEDGDILIVNEPFETGTHISDTNIYMPIFYEGELIGFAGTVAHWADIGGKSPGGYCPDSTDTFQEGICFRHQKLFEAGKKNQALWDLIGDNVRVPTIVYGDLEAQIASCRQGRLRVQALCAKYGADTIRASMAYVIEETDKAMRRAIAKLPKGVHSASIRLDGDGVDPNGEFLLCLRVEVTEDKFKFSLDGSSKAAKGPINLPGPGTRGILVSSVKGLLLPFDPSNAGHAKCVEVQLPPNSIINPERPAPTDSYGYVIVCLMELFFRCMAKVVPERCPAGGFQLTGTFLTKTHAGSGRAFVFPDPPHGGNGATWNGDGATNQLVANGDLPNSPVEVTETRFPVLIESMQFEPQGGAGKFVGGKGLRKEYRVLEDDWYVTLVTENTNDITARGVSEGHDGKPGYFVFNPGTSEEKVYTGGASLGPFSKETILRTVTGGGGGWGPPIEREPERVLADVRNNYCDLETAQTLYKVAIYEQNGDLLIDESRTRSLRAA